MPWDCQSTSHLVAATTLHLSCREGEGLSLLAEPGSQGLVGADSGVHERAPLQINGELKGQTQRSGKDWKEQRDSTEDHRGVDHLSDTSSSSAGVTNSGLTRGERAPPFPGRRDRPNGDVTGSHTAVDGSTNYWRSCAPTFTSWVY
ncbi:unnamed protein product [Boreogadus saida]